MMGKPCWPRLTAASKPDKPVPIMPITSRAMFHRTEQVIDAQMTFIKRIVSANRLVNA